MYNENGNLNVETPYKNGKMEGIDKWYNENGNLKSETPYKNGEKEGIVKWYNENGNLRSEMPYKNGEKEGMLKWYYENGNLKEEIPYKNGKTHGDVKYYTENGKPLALVKAENKFISGKCFNNKVLTDKELRNLKDFEIAYLFDDVINYLQEICLKESDSK